jgi:hypothetical protein
LKKNIERFPSNAGQLTRDNTGGSDAQIGKSYTNRLFLLLFCQLKLISYEPQFAAMMPHLKQ